MQEELRKAGLRLKDIISEMYEMPHSGGSTITTRAGTTSSKSCID